MNKPILSYIPFLAICLLVSCQSVEYLSIDYMMPAEVSFPTELRRVVVVNNMIKTADTPHDIQKEADEAWNRVNEGFAHREMSFQGIGAAAAESLAESIAEKNYFDEVIICDSALRANDATPRPTLLSEKEVRTVARQMEADFLIAVEDIQIKTQSVVTFDNYYQLFLGYTQAIVQPTFRIYLPGRQKPMLTLTPCDSIYWSGDGFSVTDVIRQLADGKEMMKQASDFAGILPMEHLLPYWNTAYRSYYAGGSVQMRDAAIYVREHNWPAAVELWQKTYQTKKGKQKMQAAYNLALGYEMQDSIDLAYQWCERAKALAYEIDKVESKLNTNGLTAEAIPHYTATSLYAAELKKRKDSMNLLRMQMRRIDETEK